MTLADLLPLAAASAFIFLAAIVRGYSGFGFSLLSITALSLLFPPAQVIPAIFLLEVAASLHLLPSIWRQVHWRSLGLLMAGALAGTPLGVHALAHLPQAPMTLALALFVLVIYSSTLFDYSLAPIRELATWVDRLDPLLRQGGR